MTTLTWVSGSTKNWSDSTAWSPAQVPTAADDLVFGGASTGTLTVDGTSGSPNLCRSFDATGFTGTITMGATAQINIGTGTAGAFKIVSGCTFAPNATSLLNFIGTASGNNITFGTKTFGNVTFNGVGGTWVFQDAALIASTSTMTLTNGTLNTNGQTVTCVQFSSNNSNTRALTLGATNWTLGTSGGVINFDITTSTGMTLSAASSTFTAPQTTASGTFNGGGLTYGVFTSTALTTGTTTITGNNSFTTLTLSCGANAASTYQLGGNMTVSGTFTSNGNSVNNRSFIRSNVRSTTRTLTVNTTVTVSNIDMQDITGAGSASWNIAAVSGNSGDCGGNSGITFTTGANQYWVPSGATSTGSWSATTRWSTSSGGTAGTGRTPLPQDTAIFDLHSIDAGSRTITTDIVRFGGVDWTGVTNTPAWAKTTAFTCFLNVTTVSGMTNSGTTSVTLAHSAAAQTFTSGTLSWTNPIAVDKGTQTLTFADAITTTQTFTETTGNVTFSSTASFTSWSTISGTCTLGGNVTLTSSFSISGATIVTGGFTFATPTSITISSGNIQGTTTITSSAGITFNTSGTFTGIQTTLTGTTVTVNGASGTWNIGTVTGTGNLTTTNGTLVIFGTLTSAAAGCKITPARLLLVNPGNVGGARS